MKKLLLMCAFVMGISAVSFAQGRGARTPEQQLAQLKTQVGATPLTDDQASKATAIFTIQAKSMDSLRTAANGDYQAMMPAFTKMRTATSAKIKAILTADQATAYQKAMDDQAAQMKARMQGGN